MLLTARQLEARAAAITPLPADLARLAHFFEAHYPAFAPIAFLAPWLVVMGPDASAPTSDTSGVTLIEASNGHWRAVMDSLGPAVPPGPACAII